MEHKTIYRVDMIVAAFEQ